MVRWPPHRSAQLYYDIRHICCLTHSFKGVWPQFDGEVRLLAFDAGLAQTARTLAHHSAVATLGPQLRSFHHRASSLPRALFARPEGDSRPDTGTRQKPYRLGARRVERPPTAGRRVRVFAHYLEPLGGAGLLTGLDRLGVGGRSHVGATCGRPTGTSRPPNLAVRRGCCPVREGHCRPEGDLRSPPPWDVSRAKSVCFESQNCTQHATARRGIPKSWLRWNRPSRRGHLRRRR